LHIFLLFFSRQLGVVQIGIRQQRKIACALDRGVDLTLIMCFGTCQTSGHNLAVFLNEVLQSVDILIIDLLNASGGEAAEFLALEEWVLLLTLLLKFALIEFFYRMPWLAPVFSNLV